MQINPTKSYKKTMTRIVEIPATVTPYESMDKRGWSLQDRREYAMLYLGQVIGFCLWMLLK